ncbi:MAG: hypothetical protein JJU34_08230 [Lunatimonas sp.]|uniref:hypothetical protein n=1 Tax=Lunatimonas sp. TaxID=2060141 RepID=UPI00263AE668|nr:hypothetical protein [Lunatimonas sp.]MCC5937253.1 hypothetical protein [Lunatimonas sp.]
MQIPITVFTSHLRSSTFLLDAVDTISAISDYFVPGRTYNIGNDDQIEICELANTVWELTGAPRSLISFKDREPQTALKKMRTFF